MHKHATANMSVQLPASPNVAPIVPGPGESTKSFDQPFNLASSPMAQQFLMAQQSQQQPGQEPGAQQNQMRMSNEFFQTEESPKKEETPKKTPSPKTNSYLQNQQYHSSPYTPVFTGQNNMQNIVHSPMAHSPMAFPLNSPQSYANLYNYTPPKMNAGPLSQQKVMITSCSPMKYQPMHGYPQETMHDQRPDVRNNYDLSKHMSDLDLNSVPMRQKQTRKRRGSTCLDIMEETGINETHIIAAALDRRQSLQLQKKIARAKANSNQEELESMFYQFLPEILRLSRDQYANFVLQRLIENLTSETVDAIVEKVQKDALIMATNQYACRVLQSVLTRCSEQSRLALVEGLLPDAEEMLQDNFGCYVLQKIIETVPCNKLTALMDQQLIPRYFDLSVHQYSCRVMQDVFRYFRDEEKMRITDCVLRSVLDLSRDSYGNYVVQKMIHYGDRVIREKTIDALLPHVDELCCNKAGSNILEKCLSKATEQQKIKIMQPIVEQPAELKRVVQDKYGNYVIQRLLVALPYSQRQTLINALTKHFQDYEDISLLNDYESYVYQTITKNDSKKPFKRTTQNYTKRQRFTQNRRYPQKQSFDTGMRFRRSDQNSNVCMRSDQFLHFRLERLHQ